MRIQYSVARFRDDPHPSRLAEIAPPEFSQVFEPISYSPYTPRIFRTEGRYVVSRSAAVYPSWRLTRQTLYANPLAQVRANSVSIASILKRGFASPSDPAQSYGIIHSPWTAGYYHWLTESLPRALVMQRECPDTILLLPSKKYQPYLETLRAIGQPKTEFFPDGRNIQLTNPVITNCPANFATTDPSLLQDLQKQILAELGIEPISPHRKIYISRARSRGRFVLNEEALIGDLEKEGFETVYAEQLSFRQQVSLFNAAKVLVSIHGAGLTNMLFMQEGTSVVEMLPYRNALLDYNKSRNSFKHDASYVRLAAAMNLAYGFLQCEHDAPQYRGTHMSNLYVDGPKLLNLVRALS